MAKVSNDPVELRRFTASLKKHARNIETEMARSRHELNSLNSAWRDQEYEKFNQEFAQSARVLKSLVERMEEYSKHLNIKANKLEEYLNARF